ncbi:alpha-L-fucosidase [Lapidilactobacillus salsurivasis]
MSEQDSERQDIEQAKAGPLTPADFAQYPEYSALKKNWHWFQNQKIGVLLHWGLYTVPGMVESWQLSDEDTWARGNKPFRPNMRQLKRDYWGLAKQFVPDYYDPDAWARLFKEAGIRYAILTTKHHDGFTLYDTALSDFKVTNPDYPAAHLQQPDLFGSFTTAMRAAGVMPGAYYSKADWHYPDYWRHDGLPKGRHADYLPSSDPQRWQRFVDFVHQQLLEISGNYGPLGMLWLDAGWVGNQREPLNFDPLMAQIRKLQPEMLIVDRTIGGRYEEYVTPERQVPDPDHLPTMPWESNIPLTHDWGYVPHGQYKSIATVIATILRVVSLGGNIVLGVGPKVDGTIAPPYRKLLRQLGAWLQLNGQGIYGTRGVQPSLFKRAAQLGWFVTEDAGHYYLFPQMTVPPRQLDLKRFDFPEPISKATLLGRTQAALPLAPTGCLGLPGGLRQQLYPGIMCVKATAGAPEVSK